VASGGAFVPEPPRATRSQPEPIRICPKNNFYAQKSGLSLAQPGLRANWVTSLTPIRMEMEIDGIIEEKD